MKQKSVLLSALLCPSSTYRTFVFGDATICYGYKRDRQNNRNTKTKKRNKIKLKWNKNVFFSLTALFTFGTLKYAISVLVVPVH